MLELLKILAFTLPSQSKLMIFSLLRRSGAFMICGKTVSLSETRCLLCLDLGGKDLERRGGAVELLDY